MNEETNWISSYKGLIILRALCLGTPKNVLIDQLQNCLPQIRDLLFKQEARVRLATAHLIAELMKHAVEIFFRNQDEFNQLMAMLLELLDKDHESVKIHIMNGIKAMFEQAHTVNKSSMLMPHFSSIINVVLGHMVNVPNMQASNILIQYADCINTCIQESRDAQMKPLHAEFNTKILEQLNTFMQNRQLLPQDKE
jgi:molybdopterin-guanine dinucleotide biosynthesis protein A